MDTSKMPKPSRAKLSTTIATENFNYLNSLVKLGKASSLAEAVDEAIEHLRRTENRRRLARATAQYFDFLSAEALSEEGSIAESLRDTATGIDFDRDL
jgi:hypothetical protein